MKNGKKLKELCLIWYFLMLWGLVGLGFIILPIHLKFGHSVEVFVVCTVFVCTISSTAILWLQNTPRWVLCKREKSPLSINKLKYIIRFSCVSTALGNALVAIDRICVRGIDYSSGVRNARYQWFEAEPGSILGKIGNLLVPFAFCALFMGVYHWEKLDIKYKICSVLIGFGGEFCLAVLNGGRSNILLSIEFVFAVCVIRKYHGKTLIPRAKLQLVSLVILALAIIRYVVSIFYAFSSNTYEYLEKLASRLGSTISEHYYGNRILDMVIEIFLYMFHGVNYIGAQIEYGTGFADLSHNMTLRGIMTILARIPGINYESQLPVFDGGSGNFMALPGQILYDYTYILFVPTCILIGVITGGILKILNKGNNNCSCYEVIYIIAVMLVLFHSPIGMAVGFSYFFFMIFAMVMMDILLVLKNGKGSSWTLTEGD